MSDSKSELVWDAPTRLFHWINAALVAVLLFSGFLFSYRNLFAMDGHDAKVLMMTAHVWVGDVFALNLIARFVWAFLGNDRARWPSIFPNRRSLARMAAELDDLLHRRPVADLVRSPVG